MSQAIDDLEQEHDAILHALGILERMTLHLDAGRPVDPQRIDSLLEFLHEFADRCHHGKEEGLLLPALLEAGLSREAAPLKRVLDDHAKGRELMQSMRQEALPLLRAPAFCTAARAYVELLRGHIAHERAELFPLAQEKLSTAQLDNLFDAFAIHESEVIGPGRHEALHELLGELGEKYAGAARPLDTAPAAPRATTYLQRKDGPDPQPSVW